MVGEASEGPGPLLQGAVAGVGGAQWSRFVSFWSLGTAVAATALFVAFASLFATTGDLPDDNAELEMAVEQPGLFVLAIVLDILVWMGLGGLFAALGALVLGRAPIRGLLVIVAGAASVAGLAAAYLRLGGTMELADRYEAAAGGSRENVLTAHLDLQEVVSAGFSAGSLVGTLALLLVASAAVAIGLPRWLAWGFGVVGTLGLLNNLLPFDALFLAYFALLIVLLFAIAWALRRRAGAAT